LLEKYKGGGTSSYHPRMLLKVIVYAYTEKIYSSRKIAKALRENVNFIWLSGANQPDFRTINSFRGVAMKEAVRAVFSKVVELLFEEGYIKLENYFVDGTKIGANANAHNYEEQERMLAGRNSYSRTDPDASNLRMKEDRAAQKPLSALPTMCKSERRDNSLLATVCTSTQETEWDILSIAHNLRKLAAQ